MIGGDDIMPRTKAIINICVSCSSSEIPQYRLPYDVVSFEVELMKDLGVKVSQIYPPSDQSEHLI